MWLWWICGGEYVVSVWKYKVVDKVVEVCVMDWVRWYDVVGLGM